MDKHGGSLDSLRGSAQRQIQLGSREQQRLEYMELTRGHMVEVDTADGGGLVIESHDQD